MGIVCNSLLCVARSQYHLFNHCHHYTAKGLREAELPISMLGALTRDGFAKQLRRIMPERVTDIETHGQRLSVSLCPGRNVDNERQDRMFSDPVRSKPLERGPDSRLDHLFVSGCSPFVITLIGRKVRHLTIQMIQVEGLLPVTTIIMCIALDSIVYSESFILRRNLRGGTRSVLQVWGNLDVR